MRKKRFINIDTESNLYFKMRFLKFIFFYVSIIYLCCFYLILFSLDPESWIFVIACLKHYLFTAHIEYLFKKKLQHSFKGQTLPNRYRFKNDEMPSLRSQFILNFMRVCSFLLFPSCPSLKRSSHYHIIFIAIFPLRMCSWNTDHVS